MSPPPMQAFRQQSARTPRDLQGCFRAQGRRVTQGCEGQTRLRRHPENPSPARIKPPRMERWNPVVRDSLGPRDSPKKPLDLAHFQFENRSRTTCSRFLQSFAFPDEAVQLQLSMEKRWRAPAVRLFCLSFAAKPKYNERCARHYRYSTRFSPNFALLRLRSTSFQVLTLLSYSNHFQDHGMYTYTNTSLYAYTNTYTYSYAFTFFCTYHNI